MKKQFIIVGIIVLLLVVGLSGCINQQQDNTEPLDTDGDGYPDSEDDFPNDSNLYLKAPFEGYALGEFSESVGVNLPPHGNDMNSLIHYDTIESDWEYVECKWSIQPNNASIREYFVFAIRNPTGYTEYTGNELSAVMNYRETIDYNNFGYWELIFMYKGGVSGTPTYLPDYVTVTFEICKVK